MASLRRDLVHANIARYERRLETETNPTTRGTLQSLLTEAREEALLLDGESALEHSHGNFQELLRHAEGWRLKAAECRTIAAACESVSARSSYLDMARRYDALADRAVAKAEAEGRPKIEQ